MAKERNWVGYANLASNLAQNLQLRQTNQTLEQLQRATNLSAIHEQANRQAQEHEARMRDHVFQLTEDVECLHRHLQEQPCAALALTLEIEAMLEKNKVSTASFHAWEDKDRFKNLVKGLKDIREKVNALLDFEAKEKAARCVKYRAEMPALNQMISIQSKINQFRRDRDDLEKRLNIDGKRVEIETLKSEESRSPCPAWANAGLMLGAMGIFLSLIWLIMAGGPSLFDENVTPHWISIVSASGLLLTSIVVAIASWRAPGMRRGFELAGKKTSVEAEIASAKAELAQFDLKSPIKQKGTGIYADPFGRDYGREVEVAIMQRNGPSHEWATQTRLDELCAMFGSDLPVEAYERMQREREALINKVFGKPDVSDAVNDSTLTLEQATTPKLDEKWEKWGTSQSG